ncbi:hypothetical protein NHX12_016831, partial [Muraenolepis orangiensis]
MERSTQTLNGAAETKKIQTDKRQILSIQTERLLWFLVFPVLYLQHGGKLWRVSVSPS